MAKLAQHAPLIVLVAQALLFVRLAIRDMVYKAVNATLAQLELSFPDKTVKLVLAHALVVPVVQAVRPVSLDMPCRIVNVLHAPQELI